MLADFLKLSFSNLKRRGLRSWLTMVGIFIGIAAVVSLIGLGEGLRTAITSQFGFLGPDILSVQAAGVQYGPPGSGAVTPLSNDLAEKIGRVNGVEVAINRYTATIMMEFRDTQIITLAMSSPEKDARQKFIRMMNLKTQSGRMLRDDDGKKAVLGAGFAKDDNPFGRAIKTGDKVLLNKEQFDVAGILEGKGSFIFDMAIVVNEGPMFDHLREDDGTVDVIGVVVKDVKDADRVKNDIEKLMRKERGVKEGEEDFSVESPQQMLEALNSTLFAVQLFVYIIASISLLVGGIGIMNTMYTAVVERTKEIGIMKSIGAKNSTVFLIFLIESGFMGMAGGIIGIMLGASLAYGIAYAGSIFLGSDMIQAHVGLWLVAGSLAFAFALGTFFGVMPAYQASKLQPVDSLRAAK